MKYRIHFTIDEYEDYFDIEGETIEELRIIAAREEAKRGLTEHKNNLWSEKLKWNTD